MTGPAFETIISALESHGHRVRRHGNYAHTTCTHEGADNPQGLSVFDNGSRVKLTCFTRGCDGAEIVESLGLTLRDLYHNPRTTYSYDDGRIVHRDTDAKNFRQSGNTQGAPTLYRRSRVADAVAEGRTVYLVEGEEDVHSLEAIGQVATTAPMGARSFARVDVTPLTGADIIAIPDRDDEGERWAQLVTERLDGVAASLVIAHPAVGKDASDHIAADLGVDDLKRDDPAAARRAATLARHPAINLAALLDPNRPPREYVMCGLLPAGAAVSLAAPAGTGKSLLALAIALAVARGNRRFAGLDIPRSRRVLYIDMENTADDLGERFESFGVTQDTDLGGLTYLSFPELPPLDTSAGAGELLDILAAYEHQPGDLLIIDSLQRVISGEENSSDTMRAYYLHTGIKLKRCGFTSLRLDNTGKDAARGSRGTSGKRDDVDLELVMLPDEDRPDDLFRIAINKTRLADISPIALERFVDRDGLTRFSTSDDPFRCAVNAAKDQLDAAAVPFDSGIQQARHALQGRNYTERAIRTAVRERRSQTAKPCTCDACGLAMVSLGDGATTHPNCEGGL